MEREQFWRDCKYSAKGIVSCSEYYSCLNENIAKIGAYRKLNLEREDGSKVVSSTLFNHSHLNPGGKLDLEWPQTIFLQSRINRALAGCRHCKLYEPRNGKQTKFGKLKVENKGGITYTSVELKIVNS